MVKFKKSVEKDLKKLDKKDQINILEFLSTKIIDNPRTYGKALKGYSPPLWRYRVGNFRIICDIKDKEVVVLVLRIGNRRDIYKRK